MITVSCQQCSVEFQVYPRSLRRGGGRYCSRLCMGTARRRSVEHACFQCGKIFYPRPEQIRLGRGKWCSLYCRSFARANAPEDFWNYVNKKGPPHPYYVEFGNCWIWVGTLFPNKYGYFIMRQKGYLAHRFAFYLKHGNILDKKLVLHSCDNPPCVNPDHLRLGTHLDNITDCISRGRRVLNPRQGEQSPGAKLTESQVHEIRSLKGVKKAKYLTTQFHVSSSTIYKIWHNKTWQYLT